MRRIPGGALVLVLAWPALRAEDKKDKPATPGAQYQALLKEYQDAQKEFWKAYEQAKTDKERQKLDERYPRPEKLAPRFLELAEKNPKAPAAVDALVWVASNVRQSGKDNLRERALAILTRDHIANAEVSPVCDSLIYMDDLASETFLRAVLEKSSSKEVQGRACLALGMHFHYLLQQVEQLRGNESRYDKETVTRLKKIALAKLAKEMKGLLERAASEYADVRHPDFTTVGKQAKSELYEIRFLAVGREAPDVEGEDQDGKKFKLSEYRGKVVLLDFWGNW
jgi:hypothetical protein